MADILRAHGDRFLDRYRSSFGYQQLKAFRAIQKLSSELSELSRQHAKALEDDVFLGLTNERIADFERRRKRISELCEIVGKAKLK